MPFKYARTTGVAIILAAIVYSTWLLSGLLGSHLSWVNAYASELAASGQPTAKVTRIGDGVASLLVSGTGMVGLNNLGRNVHWRKINRWGRRCALLGFGGLVLIGVATIVDVSFPMQCAVSLASCKAQLAHSTSWVHRVHEGSSIVVGGAWIAAGVGLTGLLSPRSGLKLHKLMPVSRYLTGIMTAASAFYAITAAVLEVLQRYSGIAQRVHLTILFVWMVVFGLELIISPKRWRRLRRAFR